MLRSFTHKTTAEKSEVENVSKALGLKSKLSFLHSTFGFIALLVALYFNDFMVKWKKKFKYKYCHLQNHNYLIIYFFLSSIFHRKNSVFHVLNWSALISRVTLMWGGKPRV